MSTDPLLALIMSMASHINISVPYHDQFQHRFNDQWHILSTAVKIDPGLKARIQKCIDRPELIVETGLSRELSELATLAAIVMKYHREV